MQFEMGDEPCGEPSHKGQVRDDGGGPDGEGEFVGGGRQVNGQLHKGHEQRCADACQNGIMQVVANHVGEQDDFRSEQSNEGKRERAANDMDRFGVRLQ